MSTDSTAPGNAATDSEQARNSRRVQQGIVTSAKMDKTITVMSERRFKHPLYEKFMTRSTKVHAHDDSNECRQGDRVEIMETRPVSKLKRWRLVKVLEKAVD